jgi:hypothetical protein
MMAMLMSEFYPEECPGPRNRVRRRSVPRFEWRSRMLEKEACDRHEDF